MNRAIAISNENFIITNGIDDDLRQYFAFGNVEINVVDNFDELSKEDIYQIMCSCKKDEYQKVLKGVNKTTITAWWDRAIDIIPSNGGKGEAIKRVLEYYGFSKDEAMAFGDGTNDIEMFNEVKYSVAMGNAKENVKEKAKDICKSVDEDGIYYYCLENKLIK